MENVKKKKTSPQKRRGKMDRIHSTTNKNFNIILISYIFTSR
jgi:hypothetical protein